MGVVVFPSECSAFLSLGVHTRLSLRLRTWTARDVCLRPSGQPRFSWLSAGVVGIGSRHRRGLVPLPTQSRLQRPSSSRKMRRVRANHDARQVMLGSSPGISKKCPSVDIPHAVRSHQPDWVGFGVTPANGDTPSVLAVSTTSTVFSSLRFDCPAEQSPTMGFTLPARAACVPLKTRHHLVATRPCNGCKSRGDEALPAGWVHMPSEAFPSVQAALMSPCGHPSTLFPAYPLFFSCLQRM